MKHLEQLYAAGECLNWYNLENHLSESPKGEQMYDKAIFPEKHIGLFKDTYRNIVVIFVIGKTGKSKIEFLKIWYIHIMEWCTSTKLTLLQEHGLISQK